jgi:hypothetical protein
VKAVVQRKEATVLRARETRCCSTSVKLRLLFQLGHSPTLLDRGAGNSRDTPVSQDRPDIATYTTAGILGRLILATVT